MATGGSTFVVIAALGANLLIAVAKFGAAMVTNSSAMLAEAFHSVADTVNQALLLLGVKLSTRPADRKHPFGYAMERYFWAFVVAIIIFTLGAAFSTYEGIAKIRHLGDPSHALKQPIWGVAVLSLSILIEGVSWALAVREFFRQKGPRPIGEALRDSRDPVLITVLFEDSAAMAGLIIALTGVSLSWITGNMLFDGMASLVVGLVLAAVALLLARETKDMLLGESVAPQDSHRIREIVTSSPHVEHLVVHRTMHLGPDDVLLVLKVQFEDGLDLDGVETAINGIEQRLRVDLSYLKRIWIEPGSAEPAAALPRQPGPLDP